MKHTHSHTIYAPYEKAEYFPAQKHVAPPKVPTRIEDHVRGGQGHTSNDVQDGASIVWVLGLAFVAICVIAWWLR